MLHRDNKKTQKKSHTHTVKAVAAWLEWRKDEFPEGLRTPSSKREAVKIEQQGLVHEYIKRSLAGHHFYNKVGWLANGWMTRCYPNALLS